MRDAKLIIGCIAIFLIVAAGGLYVYGFNANDAYSCSSNMENGNMSYTVHSSISNCYDVLVSYNGDFASPTEYYLYYDPDYADNISDVDQPIGSTKLDFGYYVSQLTIQLKDRGIEVIKVDSAELSERMSSDISGGSCRKGLIDVAGTLPSTVYQGHSDDLILKWVDEGGCLYWVGGPLGATYSTPSGFIDVPDYESIFFGCDCINAGPADKAYSEITQNEYKTKLALSGNSVKYGIDASMLPDSLSVGFTESDYSSIVLAKSGNGMICVVAGDYSNGQRADLAQVISAHLCYKSELVLCKSGTVTRGTVSDNIEMITPGGQYAVYTYLGGYFPVYGRCDLHDIV